MDLVYSVAIRMVRDPHLAEDVTQGVFVALAKQAPELVERVTLAGWMHRTAQNIAAQTVRTIERRRAREQEAVAMNEMFSTLEASWEQIEPHLDAALGELSDADRDAVLLRYFQKKSAIEIAAILGVSDDTAQKRVSRAVEKLREFFAKKKITVGAGSLGILISANAVQAAPVGLAITISAAAILTGTAVHTSTIITATKTIAMTTLQKILIATTITAAVGMGIYAARQNSKLREQVHLLQQQLPLTGQIDQLQRERDDATNRLVGVTEELAKARKNPNEVLKLRGQVGALRQENKMAGEKSAISKITSDPASRKAMREQQKMGMSALYTTYAKQLNLAPEIAGKFNDLLADSVMDNIDLITQALHDGKSQSEVKQIFSAADTALQGKVQTLLGDDALAQYKNYTQNLASTLTVAQFQGELTGDKAAKEEKKKQFEEVMQQETAAALKSAGLSADYQVFPILNFGNIASEGEANQNLNLLDGIYASVATRSSSFLTPEELASFQTFRTNALNNSRMALTMNRNLMAPLSK